jgi:hypothetical protein
MRKAFVFDVAATSRPSRGRLVALSDLRERESNRRAEYGYHVPSGFRNFDAVKITLAREAVNDMPRKQSLAHERQQKS